MVRRPTLLHLGCTQPERGDEKRSGYTPDSSDSLSLIRERHQDPANRQNLRSAISAPLVQICHHRKDTLTDPHAALVDRNPLICGWF